MAAAGAVGVAVGSGTMLVAGRRVGTFRGPGVAAGGTFVVGVAVGIGSLRMLGVGVGVGRLSGAMIGPEVGIGRGVGRVEGGRLNVTGGVLCGAALFDCATAGAGSIAAAANHTPARFKTLDPVIRVTL